MNKTLFESSLLFFLFIHIILIYIKTVLCKIIICVVIVDAFPRLLFEMYKYLLSFL